MPNGHAFTITRRNNITEKEGIDYLLSENEHFVLPSKESRKEIMDILNIDARFSRAFDLLYINDDNILNNDELLIKSPSDVTLIELKTIKKELPNSPRGFFFGATENEFELARKMGDRYKFCFVSLHPNTKSYKLLDLLELNGLIRNKRIQYQINLIR